MILDKIKHLIIVKRFDFYRCLKYIVIKNAHTLNECENTYF